jgi:hypothetical protein
MHVLKSKARCIGLIEAKLDPAVYEDRMLMCTRILEAEGIDESQIGFTGTGDRILCTACQTYVLLYKYHIISTSHC